jgi:hypothetical protein
MLRVLKYGTGHEIPEGATYLTTVVEEGRLARFVWHYFSVPCDKDGNPPATRERP